MSNSSMDFTKLTVPQLRAVCKEHRITGYSKLGKAALLQKLTDHCGSAIGTLSSSKTTTNVVSQEAARMPVHPGLAIAETLVSVAIKKPCAPPEPKVVPSSSSSLKQSPNIPPSIFSVRNHHLDFSFGNHGTLHASPPAPGISSESSHMHLATTFSRLKRPANLPNDDATPDISNKKPKRPRNLFVGASASSAPSNVISVQNHVPSSDKQYSISMAPPPVPKPTKASGSQLPALVRPAISSKQSTTFLPPSLRPRPTLHTGTLSVKIPSNIVNTALDPQTLEAVLKVIPPGKRFKPLVLKRDLTSPQLMPSAKDSHKAVSTSLISDVQVASSGTAPLRHLDFPQVPFDLLTLASISLPPKLSKRKLVHRWSVILSGLSDDERRQCVLVSRMFRYSVYLSAIHLLEKKFNGRRLVRLTLKHPQKTTNMWPYLRHRELEVQMRVQAYTGSFLAKYSKNLDFISERLWTSPDNEKQMVVAVRFILTRFWFLISVGGGGSDRLAWSCGVVVDAQEVVKDEIWTVIVQTACSQQDDASVFRTETFYVLEQTCEVIGQPLPSALPTASNAVDGADAPSSIIQLRADWSDYIAHRASVHGSSPLPLLSRLKWQNHEEYYKGLSRLWLKRIAGEGELGIAKRIVADRYVLSCVVGNSVSGSWMSSTQMEQTFAGNAAIIPARAQLQQVSLFLPAHHHVESLHFTAANGRPLHTALAVVQTPNQEYYILRDNGAQVGCSLGEEDGVAPVWMELLGCTTFGETMARP